MSTQDVQAGVKGDTLTVNDDLCINTIRFLSVDGVQKANSGHPGMPMGDATMAYTLWTRVLNHSPGNPRWPGRDRFVLSAGHGSMLLYSLLHLTGYNLTLDDLKEFRQSGSHTAGHPEFDLDRGIEATTGPLGQGFAMGVGMAMAERYLADRYNRDGFNLFDYKIYAITSDGDHMEGISGEAASIAGHLGLGSIVYLYSDNKISIEGSTDIAFTEDVAKRFEAYGWHVATVDGDDLEGIEAALKAGKAEKDRPSIILARTVIGKGSPNKEGTAGSHGAPLGADEVKLTKEAAGWPADKEFHIPGEVLTYFRGAVDAGKEAEEGWNRLFEDYQKAHPEAGAELKALLEGGIGAEWMDKVPAFETDGKGVATRSASGKFLNAVAASIPNLVGGSADLAPSNNTHLNDEEDFERGKSGRNIHFGVREHAMGAIMNGMALSTPLVVYGGTFLVFSDYMRGAIRLAALMGQHVIYVFTHDSIGLGEDGPTHQPVEHLPSLRAMPNLTVIRPGDANETVEAWKVALQNSGGPTALVLSRQNMPTLDREVYAPASELARGGYVLSDCECEGDECKGDLILIASGSEVSLALGAATELRKEGLKVRVVSMPSFELFESQDKEYRDKVLPPSIRRRLSIEAASTDGWHRYVGLDGEAVGMNSFGASAPSGALFERFGFTVDNIVAKAKGLF